MNSYLNRVSEILSVFVLFNIAIAQPLYDLLARNSEFFVAKHSKPFEIVLLTIVLSIAAPGILVFLEIIFGWIYPRLRKWLHGFFVTILVALIAMPVLKRWEAVPGSIVIFFSLLLGFLFWIVTNRWRPGRLFINYLSPAILIVPALFLMNPFVSKILHSESSSLPVVSRVSATAPVIVIVLDELPLVSLLDENENIDPVRYPKLRGLMEDSIWFRKATTVADGTAESISAILTGKYPDPSRLAILKDYPQNLFTLLAGSYELRVFEPITKLCPNVFNVSGEKPAGINEQMESILSDLSAIYLHVVLPADCTNDLPTVKQSWGDFWNQNQSGNAVTRIRNPYPQRMEQFQRFLNLVGPGKRPGLFFLHILIPHIPWEYLPSGKRYDYRSFGPMGSEGLSMTEQVWLNDEWVVARGYQRHLLQVGFADRMVGILLDKLKATGLYDPALIVLTADHGASFQAGTSYRSVDNKNFKDILPVPLFVKLPHSQRKEVSQREVVSVDILPTIADALGIEMNWKVDGISALRNDSLSRGETKRIFRNVNTLTKSWAAFDSKSLEIQTSLRKKIDLFGDRNMHGLFQINGFSTLSVAEFIPQEHELKSVFQNEVNLFSDFVPVFATSKIVFSNADSRQTLLGVLVNGELRGITRTYFPYKDVGSWLQTVRLNSTGGMNESNSASKGVQGFGMILPEESFLQGRNEIQIVNLTAWAKANGLNPELKITVPHR